MNADFFFKFTKFRFGSLLNAEDFSDKVNYQWTGAFLIIFTAIIAMRQYIFTPIQCWVPPEWPRPWEEYTENYCWIQNTYHVATMDPEHPEPLDRKRFELNYYQWVPFVLALEALLVYMPHLIWKMISMRTGYNPNAIVKFAAEATTLDQDRKKKLICFLARHIEKALNCRGACREKPHLAKDDNRMERFSQACHRYLPFFWFGKRSGSMLLALYIFNKLLYIVVAVGHLFVMKTFLGFDSLAFGWYCLYNLVRGREWEQTRVFPRVTFCDVPSKHVGQWNVRSVQCVLPVNLLNEKIYIFLWFWTLLCLFLTITSTLMWLIRLLVLKNRQRFIKRYLLVLKSTPEEARRDRDARHHFVTRFLSHDGVFILRIIAENIGDVCAAEIIEEMYRRYCSPDPPEEQQPPVAQSNGPRRASSATLNMAPRRVSILAPKEEFPGKKSFV